MKSKIYIYGTIGAVFLLGGCYWVVDRGLGFNLSGNNKCLPTQPSIEATAATTPSPVKSFSVPIVQKYGGVPAIEVTLNGMKVPMLFDTGASHTLITDRVAKQLRLRERGSALAETAQGKINFPTATLDRLEFGRLQVSNLNVSIADPNLRMGLLGQDVFSEYEIKISQRSIEFKQIEIPKTNGDGFERY